MKKFLLSIALVLFAGTTMAQTTNTVKFTFARTGTGLTDIPVNVTVNGVTTEDITATLSASATNVTKLMSLSDNGIVCFANEGTGNSSAATEAAPHIYTLTINGLDGETLKNISIANKALTGSGDWQGTSVNRQRHYNVSSGTSTENLTLVEDRIDLISVTGTMGNIERAKDFVVDNVEIGTTLVIQLKMYNASDITGNEALGCFYGLTGFTLTTEVKPEPEPEPTFAKSYTLTQVTASDLMSKTTATRIAIRNVAFNNHNWLDIKNAANSDNSPAEYSEEVVFIWEPVTTGEAGSYRIKDNNGEYLQNDASDNVITLGTIDNAAVFTAVEPTFSYDEASKIFSESEQDKLVRFKRTDNVWINTQQPAQLAKYNTGTGTFTIHFAYELTEVEKFTANFTKAEYASFYAPSSVTIPEGVEAYYLTNEGFNGDHVTLTKIDGGIIPALTAVILKSSSNKVIDLSVTEDTSTEDLSANLFKGTVVKRHTQVEENGAYVLGIVDEEVGLYKSNKTSITNTYTIHVFLNNANKAYLPANAVPASIQNAASFSFRFPGTTGVENVVVENEVKAIYDLTGRRVSEITEAGIYIIGGRKVLVK